MRPRACLVDIGGVIFQNQWELVARHLASLGRGRVADYQRVLERQARALDLAKVNLRSFFTKVRAETGVPISWVPFKGLCLDTSLKPIRSNIVAVREVKRASGARFVAVTNVGPEVANAVEKKVPLAATFDGIVRSFEVGARKPARAFFRAALTLAGCSPGEAFLIDDSSENVRSARTQGIRSVEIVEPRMVPLVLSNIFVSSGRKQGMASGRTRGDDVK